MGGGQLDERPPPGGSTLAPQPAPAEWRHAEVLTGRIRSTAVVSCLAAAKIRGVEDAEVYDVIMLTCQTSECGGDLAAVSYAERLADIFTNERFVFTRYVNHVFDK